MPTYYNINTGVSMDECDFYDMVMAETYTCCSQSENVWIMDGSIAYNEYQWQVYFTANPPSCCNAPVNDIPPALQYNTLNEGDTITVDDGTWSGDATITFTYQWLRDNVSVPGETNPSYTITSADHGTDISCRVTATNDCGNASEISDSVAIP